VTPKPILTAAVLVLVGLLAAACNREGRAASQGTDPAAGTGSPAAQPGCGHTACGSNFFVDAVAPADCSSGARCTVDVKLVATGDFHINDEYPYKFKAEDAAGVEFLGADAAGKNTFSKDAKDWKKRDEKSGVMTLAFRSDEKGQKSVGGTFKLSVCSAQNCQLEQQPVRATVAVR
jgi:hypothetical protein